MSCIFGALKIRLVKFHNLLATQRINCRVTNDERLYRKQQEGRDLDDQD